LLPENIVNEYLLITMSVTDTMLYCYSCSTNTDTDTDTDSEGDAFVTSKAQVLKTLPKLVRIKPHPKKEGRARTARSINSNRSNEGGITNAWREKLLRISNIASFLCVIDCTVLPVVTILLPLIGIGASPQREEWLHHMGHKVAMNFVLPVGGLAATINYTSHKRASLALLSTLGLILILLANSSCHSPVVSIFPHYIVHLLHDGLTHRFVNISGCALLLVSNYFGHESVCDPGSFSGFCCIGRRTKTRKRHQD